VLTPLFWLAIWLVGMAGSIAFHEWAHVVVAKAYGWRYNGITVKWWVAGIGVKLESKDERGLWAIALAGPIATLIAAGVFWLLALLPSESAQAIFPSLVAFNLVVAFVNLIPTPITDGGHIVKSLTGIQLKWRYTLGIWIALEAAVLWWIWFT
jgi:Zn-dependent protease